MKKQFNLQSFKSSAAKMSDYLKNKGHKVPYSVLLNSLSLFLGEKNWNTLEHVFNDSKSDQQSLFDKNSSIYIISSSQQSKIDEYINKIVISHISNTFSDKRIVQKNNCEFNQCNFSNVILFDKKIKDNNFFIKYAMRLDPDYIVINELKDQAESIIMAAMTGHIVIAGIVSNSKEDVKDEIFNNFISEDQRNYKNAIILDKFISSVIYLD